MLARLKPARFQGRDHFQENIETGAELIALTIVERAQCAGKVPGEFVPDRRARFAAGFGEFEVDPAAVIRFGLAPNESAPLEAIDQTGHDGRSDHQPPRQLAWGGWFMFDDVERTQLAQAQFALDLILQHGRLRPSVEARDHIQRVVRNGFVRNVLDHGSGTTLLLLYPARHHPSCSSIRLDEAFRLAK